MTEDRLAEVLAPKPPAGPPPSAILERRPHPAPREPLIVTGPSVVQLVHEQVQRESAEAAAVQAAQEPAPAPEPPAPPPPAPELPRAPVPRQVSPERKEWRAFRIRDRVAAVQRQRELQAEAKPAPEKIRVRRTPDPVTGDPLYDLQPVPAEAPAPAQEPAEPPARPNPPPRRPRQPRAVPARPVEASGPGSLEDRIEQMALEFAGEVLRLVAGARVEDLIPR